MSGAGQTGPVGDWALVRKALVEAGLPSEDFGRFTAGRHPDVIRPEDFDDTLAIPVLLECLPSVTDPKVKEAIVRSLSTSAAKPVAAPALFSEFVSTSDAEQPALKWAIGNGLNTVTDRSHLQQLVELCADASHGQGRQMLVLRIGYFRNEDNVTGVLVSLLDDEEVTVHAMSALRTQVGPEQARPHIEPLVGAPSELVRRTAVRNLKSIDTAIARRAAR